MSTYSLVGSGGVWGHAESYGADKKKHILLFALSAGKALSCRLCLCNYGASSQMKSSLMTRDGIDVSFS